MWFDAANTDATSSGQEISTWSDSSVNSLSATTYIHGLQTLKPIYLENQLNGYPVIRFPKSGSNYASIKTVPFAFTETLIVICVIKQTYTSPAGTAFMDASQSGPPAGFPRFWGLYQWAGGQLRVKVGGWTSSLAVSSGQWGVITCYINGFSSWIRINQGTKSTGLLESLLAASGLQMGNFFSGDIAELILDTNSSLTEAEITGIENYLMDKYSV
jgi:hypothetical protein